MQKKTIIIIIAIAVAVALAITGAIIWIVSSLKGGSSNNKGDMTISIDSKTASVGDTVKIPVRVKANKGFMAILLECEYDKNVLEYVSYDKGDFLTDYEVTNDNGVIKFMSLEDGDVDDNGVLVNLEFKAIGKSGDSSDLKLNIAEGNICNFDEQIVPVKTENGKVTVK